MTQPQDPRKHPLQDDEVALARVLRALPAGEPSERLDDAILRAATDAAPTEQRTPPRARRWLPSWAIGTAAAAVLAVGIGLQLRPPLDPVAPQASRAEAAKAAPEARGQVHEDRVEPGQAGAPPQPSEPPMLTGPAPAAPPPPPAPPAPAREVTPAPTGVPEPFPAPTAAVLPAETGDRNVAMDAAASAELIQERESQALGETTAQARRVRQEDEARSAQAKAAAPPPSRQDSAAAAPAPRAEAMTDAAAAAEILPPVADDARLAPEAWLDRIRERRRQGDSAGARASLRLFLQAHPGAPVPSDLARLR